MATDLSDELAAVVRKLYPTELLRSADEGGGVQLSFITNNRLYQLEVHTEDTPLEFTLSSGTENLFMEAPPGGMQAFVATMRKKFPSANYGPRGPHGADFSTSALGRKLPGPKLEVEFLRCKQVVDQCLDGQSRVAFDM
jgi:hypothetical protein